MVKQSHYSRSISEHIVSGLVSHKLLKRVTQLVSLVERELITLPGHMVHPRFLVGLVLLNLQFSMQYFIDNCLSFFLFILTIVLSVFLPCMASNYSFGIFKLFWGGPGGSMSQIVGLTNNSYKPITNTAWVHARLCKLQKGCTRLAAASDKVYQLLAHGRWFSPGTPVSSTTKTCRQDIAEILLKVALNTINQIKSIFSFS